MKTLRIPSGVTAVKLSWSRILPMLLLAALLSGCGAQAQPAEPSPKPVQELPADAVVSYLGPAGTYTEQAAELLFSQSTQLQPRATVAEALDDVMEGRADYAVIPQENTIGGPVYDYLDELKMAVLADYTRAYGQDGQPLKFSRRVAQKITTLPLEDALARLSVG